MRATFFVGLAVAAIALLLGACEEGAVIDHKPNGLTTPMAPSPVGFQTVDAGHQSGIVLEEPQAFKLATEEEWAGFWSRHKSNELPAADLPRVDFSQGMVIAAVDQQEPSGGFSLEITAIEDDGGRLVVRVGKQVPGPDCVVTQALTQPFHIVRTARSGLAPELVVTHETCSCH